MHPINGDLGRYREILGNRTDILLIEVLEAQTEILQFMEEGNP